jgi:hypothetical protein
LSYVPSSNPMKPVILSRTTTVSEKLPILHGDEGSMPLDTGCVVWQECFICCAVRSGAGYTTVTETYTYTDICDYLPRVQELKALAVAEALSSWLCYNYSRSFIFVAFSSSFLSCFPFFLSSASFSFVLLSFLHSILINFCLFHIYSFPSYVLLYFSLF